MADETKQVFSAESLARLEKLKDAFPERKSVVLPVLHVIYDQFGHIDMQALKKAAEYMELPYVYFEEAASFYTMFPDKPVGKYYIHVCRNLSCTLMGSEQLLDYLKEKLGIDEGETTDDGLFTLGTVECLGACGGAPVMQVNDDYYENLTRAKIDEILTDLRNKR